MRRIHAHQHHGQERREWLGLRPVRWLPREDCQLPVNQAGWNEWARFYRPRKELLDGTWKFTEPQPLS
jgi:hypothetical protein